MLKMENTIFRAHSCVHRDTSKKFLENQMKGKFVVQNTWKSTHNPFIIFSPQPFCACEWKPGAS